MARDCPLRSPWPPLHFLCPWSCLSWTCYVGSNGQRMAAWAASFLQHDAAKACVHRPCPPADAPPSGGDLSLCHSTSRSCGRLVADTHQPGCFCFWVAPLRTSTCSVCSHHYPARQGSNVNFVLLVHREARRLLWVSLDSRGVWLCVVDVGAKSHTASGGWYDLQEAIV